MHFQKATLSAPKFSKGRKQFIAVCLGKAHQGMAKHYLVQQQQPRRDFEENLTMEAP